MRALAAKTGIDASGFRDGLIPVIARVADVHRDFRTDADHADRLRRRIRERTDRRGRTRRIRASAEMVLRAWQNVAGP